MCLFAAMVLGGCHHAPPMEHGRLVQRGYLWQRDWTPTVADAFREAEKRTDGVVILGAEIEWEGKMGWVHKATIPWETLKQSGKPCGLAVRIAPYPGPFSENDPQVQMIAGVIKSLLDEAHAHDVALGEFQLDFDCAERKLGGYRTWLRTLVPLVHPTRFVITTLPSWLDESEFPALVRDVDGYVLQVHSVPTLAESGHAVLCDPELARKWVAEASNLGMPFSVGVADLPVSRRVRSVGKIAWRGDGQRGTVVAAGDAHPRVWHECG